jgi:ATP-dependent DNA ligase
LLAERPPSGPDWLHEIKHDGFRIIARRDANGV